MPSQKIKRNISRIIPFGLIWLMSSIIYSLLERGHLGHLKYYPSTGVPYNFSSTIFITAAMSIVLGLLIGTIEILYFHRLFVRTTFVIKGIFKTLIYLVFIILFLWINTIITTSIELKTDLFNKEVLDNVWAFFFNYSFWSVSIYIAATIGISLFYTEVSEHLGQGVLNNFFIGKYHSPVEEERVFMFLDMKSSTTIAENIGHVRYFEMIKEYFADMSDSIIEHSGEIYQYVGDEIIVSWKLQKGLQNNNCIQCFFSIKKAITKQSKKYNKDFGLLPEFKAGFHLGKVTSGEIGIIKKDITFSGDVLNTASRIQGLCNDYEVDILVSGDLIKRLEHYNKFQIKSLGENELRGRDEKMELFTILSL